MSIKVRFKVTQTQRTALFQQSSKRDFDQTGWGTTVKLTQVREDAMTVPMQLVLNGIEAKMFDDAPVGAEFDIVISPSVSIKAE
jgi:hypothetical protein